MDQQPSKRQIKKPGLSDDKQKALDSLLRAKTYGIKRTDQFDARSEESEKNDGKEESDDGLDDFIDKEGYDYDIEEEEELEEEHIRKKKNKTASGMASLYNYMKPNSNMGQKKNVEKKQNPKSKITETQSKDIMESLFNEYFGGTDDPNKMEIIPENKEVSPQAIYPSSYRNPINNKIEKPLNKLEISNMEYDVMIQPVKSKNIKINNNDHAHQMNIEEVASHIIEQMEEEYEPRPTNDIYPTQSCDGRNLEKKTENLRIQEATNPIEKSKEKEKPKMNLFDTIRSSHPQQAKPSIIVQASSSVNNLPIQINNNQNNLSNNVNDSELFDLTPNNNNNESLMETQRNIADHSLILDEDGNLLFYYYDAFEDVQLYPGIVFLFGKALQRNTQKYESVCVIVQNLQRNIFIVNKEDVPFPEISAELEDVKKKYFSRYLFSWSKELTKKKYAFELPISYEEKEYTLVKYSYQFPPLPADLKGKNFDAIIGTSYSALELFLLKRKIRGPQWLLIRKGAFSPAKPARTWCGFEFCVDKKKEVLVVSKETKLQTPPFKVLSLSMKYLKHKATKKQEIIIISGYFSSEIIVEGVDKKKSTARPFTIIRKLDAQGFPAGFENKIKSSSYSYQNIKAVANEFALIDLLINRVDALDPDIIVGHDLYSSLFEKILSRIGDKRINNWSRLGKLQKGFLPKGNSSLFKVRSATVGRLLVDTYLSARELVREPDYSLEHLSKIHLSKERKIRDPEFFEKDFDLCDDLLDLVESTSLDSLLTMELLGKLQILPLTKELTNIAGNLWIKSLQNSRAERNEMLLMHEFYQQNYLFPDKYHYTYEDKALLEEEKTEKKNKKTQKYSGGLVLEPKKGLYDKFVLLLDFNSLYPSLIQEYNICFTTVKRPSIPLEKILAAKNKNSKGEIEENNEEQVDPSEIIVDSEKKNSILPKVIKNLVDKRRAVKNQLKKAESIEEKQNLDIKQKAIKLIANSIYGCLGFSSSRFYAKPIAALITCKGRDTLTRARDLVIEKLGFDVIYGDTDSIMINTNCDSDRLGDALQIGFKIKKEINALSINKKLEIDIDGIFKPMLLLKKKKYAAKKILNLGDIMINPKIEPKFVQEFKGLDMVRRDWCDLSKKSSQKILDIMLGAVNRDFVVGEIMDSLKEINEKLKQPCSLKDFLIRKQLTKHPNDYPNSKALPHVNVARRLKERGESDGNLIGRFINFIICKEENKPFAERAYDAREIKEKNLEIDILYYKSQQIMPPLIRICQFVEGLSLVELANCLELDGSKYKSFGQTEKDDFEAELGMDSVEASQNISHDAIKLFIFCTNCKNKKEYKGIWDKENKIFGIICGECKKPYKLEIILNAISKLLKDQCDKYYEGMTICQETTCGLKTKQLRLKEERCLAIDCKSKILHIYQEKRIYNNLKFLKNSFDYSLYPKTENDIKPDIKTSETFELCKAEISKYLDRCIINLGNIFNFKIK